MSECATDGCTTNFEKRSNRHKYCAVCAEARKRGCYKEWYYNRGGRNHLKKKHKLTYPEKKEEFREKSRKAYAKGGKERDQARRATPEGREQRVKYDAKKIQRRRERRVIEMLAGGRPFRFRTAPVTGEYLTGVADYTSEQFRIAVAGEVKKPKPELKPEDPYGWDGVLRRD